MLEGNASYLGAISENNGIKQLTDAPFWATDDVNVMYVKHLALNKHIAPSIAMFIKANLNKFSYGRKWTMEKMKKSPIMLSVTS